MVYWRWINLMKMSKWYDLLKIDIIYGLLKIRVTATESRENTSYIVITIYSFIAYSSKYSPMDVKWRGWCSFFIHSQDGRAVHRPRVTTYNLALRSSSLAIVPRWTSSGPSAIRSVLAVAHRCDKTVSDETPAAPWTCIAMSSTFRAIFGAATCMEAGQLHWIVLLKLLKKKVMTKKLGLYTLAIARIPRAFLFPCRSSWSAASRTKSLACSSSIRHCTRQPHAC
jgi:hypothetical protein